MTDLHPTLAAVTRRIRERSRRSRQAYLERMRAASQQGRRRHSLPCSNLAHALAGAGGSEKRRLRDGAPPNVAIVTAYNDMLSAHQPYAGYPGILKLAIRDAGGVAQVAGGVPAMCDGVTQGEAGMELSLLSRDVVAQATAVALAHDVYDAGLCLGVCDKIVPGLLIGALSFGHLPFVFVPAGPMPSGLPNREKQAVRQRHAAGAASRDELLAAEAASYHSPGTCNFYGTANSNQLLVELMGLHLPGASFEPPGSALRQALTVAAGRRAVALAEAGWDGAPIARVVDERALANAIVGLVATGGSTNHTIHLVAIARAAGLVIDWQDFDELSRAVPLLARIYPNGERDVNDFHRAGGIAFLVRQLAEAGLLHLDAVSVAESGGLAACRQAPRLEPEGLSWRDASATSGDDTVLRPLASPFSPDGGLRLLVGNLGRAVCKVSAVAPERRRVEAPCRVFDDQEALHEAFRAGELDGELVVVVRFQGPCANGMPELHKLMAPLGVLHDRGQRVALVTDGRLSGASGKVPAAIHVSPEAALGGPLARLRDGDLLLVDPDAGTLGARVAAGEWQGRAAENRPTTTQAGCGRELFVGARQRLTGAEQGAWSFGGIEEESGQAVR